MDRRRPQRRHPIPRRLRPIPGSTRGRRREPRGVRCARTRQGPRFETVLDDSVPRTIAREEGIRVTATLPLLCEAIREGRLTVPMVEQLADDLIAGDYYLPFHPGGFRWWAIHEGLIDYHQYD